jgi:ergothioneine biosynthesis protein EgtB
MNSDRGARLARRETDADPAGGALAERYRAVRKQTETLCSPLSAEDCAIQSMTEASPAKWHLAHTTWFFETFVLERELEEHRPFDEAYRVLFNSYYQTVGEQHPRPNRGMLSRPPLDEVLRYRAEIDARTLELLERPGAEQARFAKVVELGLHHEQQHQELILTDVKHMLSQNPLGPAYRKRGAPAGARREAPPLHWHWYLGGVRWIGAAADARFSFDNEGPRHRVLLQPFELASRPVTNGEYLAFIADRGYERPELWLSDGWATAERERWRAPLYWERSDGGWWAGTLDGPMPIDEAEPVTHVSYYEADAFARWSGCRLPTEQEWEVAVWKAPVEGNFVESDELHPRALRPPERADGPSQMYGDVWEWTRSPYAPYPGYVAPEGAIGEYNGKFMCNQHVLRGGSCATPRSHIRDTYRNFFYPEQRWQFSGFRLARDLTGA